MLLVLFLAAQVAAWWLVPSWSARLLVLLVSLLSLPVVRVLLSDRPV